jgi:hypothetical protein
MTFRAFLCCFRSRWLTVADFANGAFLMRKGFALTPYYFERLTPQPRTNFVCGTNQKKKINELMFFLLFDFVLVLFRSMCVSAALQPAFFWLLKWY